MVLQLHSLIKQSEMKIEENYAFYLFTFFQIIFLCRTIIFFTPVSFSGRHVHTVRIEVLTPLMHTNLRALSTPVISLLLFVLILFGKT